MAETSYDMSPTSEDERKEELPARETWNRNIDFLLACIGFSVGLGNVWRFPYLCYKNGGGAFLIPYFICVVLGGIPMFFLEVALGQFMSVGGLKAWRICPLLQGIGLATTIIMSLINIYYNVILAWALYYLFASFTSLLPWSHCNNYWNTDRCLESIHDLKPGNDSLSNISDFSYSDVTNVISNVSVRMTSAINVSGYSDPVTEFWERKVLRISPSIEEVGTIKWDLALCLLLAWIIVYFCIWKGVKTSGKVLYFTATSPYILMTVLLVRGATLPGAVEGIKFYLIPEWSKLLDTQVWVDAGTQIFFSYSVSVGTLTALGSYNKFNHNCWKDCIIFACTNSGTSFFGGFVIFSVLGFMAHNQGLSVGDVAESGPGLAFIAYPKAVAQLPMAPLWSVLFFCMILLLGLDSQFAGVEGVVTAVVDQFPNQLRRGYNKEIFVGFVCFGSFLVGLSMITDGGMYVFQLFDYYSGSKINLVVAFFECVAVAYLYGVGRFYDNIEMMLGFRINKYMKFSWLFTTPGTLMILFILCVYSHSELRYNRTYVYPDWAIAIGWILACSSVTMIPLIMSLKLATTKGTLPQRFRKLLRPRLKSHQLRPDDDPKDNVEYKPETLLELNGNTEKPPI